MQHEQRGKNIPASKGSIPPTCWGGGACNFSYPIFAASSWGVPENCVAAKKDKLIILRGDLAGSTGTLIGIDAADGIVKMAANSDLKILDLEFCAKLGDGLG